MSLLTLKHTENNHKIEANIDWGTKEVTLTFYKGNKRITDNSSEFEEMLDTITNSLKEDNYILEQYVV